MSEIVTPPPAPSPPVAPIPAETGTPPPGTSKEDEKKKGKDAPPKPAPGVAGTSEDGAAAAEKKATEALRVKLKTLEDGKEVEAEYDEATLRRLVQKGRSADKRFEEASKLAKDARRIIEEARSPASREKALEELLGSREEVRSFAEAILADTFQRSVLTPEEQAALAEKRELEELRAEKKALAEKAKQDEAEASRKTLEGRLEKTVMDIVKASGLPPEPWAILLVAQTLEPVVEHGIEVTQEDLVAEVRDAMKRRAEERDKLLVTGLQGKALLDYLGKDIVKRVLAATLEAHKPVAAEKPALKPLSGDADVIDIDGKHR